MLRTVNGQRIYEGATEPLTKDQYHLFPKAQAGDTQALETIVRANVRFVVDTAGEFVHRVLEFQDLVSEGNLGLLEAIQRFEPERGWKFISYAVWWIRQHMRAAIYDQTGAVRYPANVLQLVHKLHIIQAKDSAEGRWCTLTDQLADLPCSDHQRESVRIALMTPKAIPHSIEDSIHGARISDRHSADGGQEVYPEDAEAFDQLLTHLDSFEVLAALRGALAHLDDRRRKIVRDYYGMDGASPKTLEQIGADIGITRERVRQLRDDALTKMRNFSDLLHHHEEWVAHDDDLIQWVRESKKTAPEVTYTKRVNGRVTEKKTVKQKKVTAA